MKKATLAQRNQVDNLIRQKGTAAEQLQKIIESGLLADLLEADLTSLSRDDFRRVIRKPLLVKDFWIDVDYDVLPKDLIEDCDYFVTDRLTKNPIPVARRENGQKLMWLLQFRWPMSRIQARREIMRLDCRPAEFIELLAFGKQNPQYPNERETAIFAAGTFRDANLEGHTESPMLFHSPSSANKRCLTLALNENEWKGWENIFYLAVHDKYCLPLK